MDEEGEVYSLARQIKGVSAEELKKFMADVDKETLPTVEAAQTIAHDKPAPAPEPVDPYSRGNRPYRKGHQ